MISKARILTGLACLALAACASQGSTAYYLSHHPDDTRSRQLRHYPVARQGDLTAWLTSDHVSPAGNWLYAPGDQMPKHEIVGRIRAADMPQAVKHDGSFLIVAGYDGPLYPLWEGREAEGRLFTGTGGWIDAKLDQQGGVNTWVKVSGGHRIGGWSGFPVVIGDPDRPEAVAGAMWYKHNQLPQVGGATSTRMLKRALATLRLTDFVKE